MERDTIIKALVVAGAVGVVGFYVYNSGLWGKWTGSASTFTDQNALLAYCRANPTGQATYQDPSGQLHTASCSQWMAANPGTTAAPAPATPAAAVTAPTVQPQVLTDQADIDLANALRAAAMVNAFLGTDRANIDQWNYMLQHLPGNSDTPVLEMGSVGITRDGVHDVMDADSFVSLRKQSLAGTTGLSGFGMSDNMDAPYGWVV